MKIESQGMEETKDLKLMKMGQL